MTSTLFFEILKSKIWRAQYLNSFLSSGASGQECILLQIEEQTWSWIVKLLFGPAAVPFILLYMGEPKGVWKAESLRLTQQNIAGHWHFILWQIK